MIELLSDPQTWITLITLSAIEIVLGIDNLVFISIAVSKLPPHQREKARKFGIAVACITRIALLLTLAWLAGLTSDLFRLFGQGISVRDLVLILGGLFLLVKGSMEIKDLIIGEDESEDIHTKPLASFGMVIAQIAVIDIVFSLDSVIAAVGMANQTAVMVAAILSAVAVMLLAAKPLGHFIDNNPTIKMLALAFIVLVGAYLVLEGFEMHIPKGYIYGAMGFSALVEWLNLWSRRNAQRHGLPRRVRDIERAPAQDVQVARARQGREALHAAERAGERQLGAHGKALQQAGQAVNGRRRNGHAGG